MRSVIKRRAQRGEALAFARAAAKSVGRECVLWPFGMKTKKYGALGSVLVHRLVCLYAHGEPPTAKHEAAHSCGVHRCVNGSHLYWATRSENIMDRVKHGTHNRGERCGRSKLAAEDIKTIRADSRTTRLIAADYGVSYSHISRIKTRKEWWWLV